MRQIVQSAVFLVLLLLLVHGFFLEVCEVSSGSMAPALSGPSRATCCPRCGAPVQVGLHPGEKGYVRPTRLWQRVHCWNCGCAALDLEDCPDQRGQRVLVDKTAFLFRPPRRWEVVVFRLFGFFYIKRIIGLPGETVALKDGDVWIDGALSRKTLAELRELAVPVFDGTHLPAGHDGRERWEVDPPGSWHPLVGQELHLDGTGRGQPSQTVTYCHYFWDEQQFAPVCDEYACNGNQALPLQEVHDFLLECDVVVERGEGVMRAQITDGADTIVAEVPITIQDVPPGRLLALAGGENFAGGDVGLTGGSRGFAPSRVFFRPGNCYHVQVAFADRRATLRVNAQETVLDLPPAGRRTGVVRPVALGVRGAKVIVRNFRLYRDVHYTQAGRNGVGGRAVPLLADQYFVLGDNSPVSEDSRFWPDGGGVAAHALVGRAMRVPWPE